MNTGETHMSVNRELTLRQSFRFGQVSAEQYATELVERNAAWKSLTPEAQLADLDRRLGVGQGAKRQRAVIAARIAKANEPKPVVAKAPDAVKSQKRAPNDKKGRK